jgi:hypothetical protein
VTKVVLELDPYSERSGDFGGDIDVSEDIGIEASIKKVTCKNEKQFLYRFSIKIYKNW